MGKVIYAVNLALAVSLIRFESNSDSDKTILLTAIFYILLVVVNFLLGLLFHRNKRKYHQHFYYSSILLTVGIVVYGLRFLIDESF